MATPGHIAGHQSVYVETADGPVILAIDAIAIAEQMTMPWFPTTTPDADAALRSRDRLLALAKETGAWGPFSGDFRGAGAKTLAPPVNGARDARRED